MCVPVIVAVSLKTLLSQVFGLVMAAIVKKSCGKLKQFSEVVIISDKSEIIFCR